MMQMQNDADAYGLIEDFAVQKCWGVQLLMFAAKDQVLFFAGQSGRNTESLVSRS